MAQRPPSRRGRTTRRAAEAAVDRRSGYSAAATSGAGRRRRKATSPKPGFQHRRRVGFALGAILVLLIAASVKLVTIQTVDAAAYSAKAAAQRDRTIDLPAQRGAIYDRNGTPLAFTVEGRKLAAWPALFTSDTERHTVATIIGDALAPTVTADQVFAKLTDSSASYVYLASGLLPAQADSIVSAINDAIKPTGRSPITTERQALRQYPQGAVLSSILGTVGWDGHGTGGIEIKYDDLLSGTDGSRTVDVDSVGRPIPGTTSKEKQPVDGGDVTLTIDADMQYTVARLLKEAVDKSGSKGGMAMVSGAQDSQVYAMSTYYRGKDAAEVGNMPVTSPFEPGSVVKVVTIGAALEKGIITPTTHYAVPGQIPMGGHIIHDAWSHSRVGMTATGILAKSSNVGTLMIAQQVGQDAFARELATYGLGSKTGIQLPADSAGVVPPQSQWSATSFANLPIGQGVSITLQQMTDMYQGIANGGERIPPTIVKSTTTDGVTTPLPQRPAIHQLTKKSADTLLDMLRGTIQGGDLMHDGTAPSAAIDGYQVAGKTGTAQQVDPSCGCYSQSKVTATFAGIVPADHPAFVITVMLDAPSGGAEGGEAAAPLFHDIAVYALRKYDVPLSTSKAPIYDLYTNLGE